MPVAMEGSQTAVQQRQQVVPATLLAGQLQPISTIFRDAVAAAPGQTTLVPLLVARVPTAAAGAAVERGTTQTAALAVSAGQGLHLSYRGDMFRHTVGKSPHGRRS